ncbi:MAG TPA: hypothetical protein VF941_07055 [Clostridia bacterium]
MKKSVCFLISIAFLFTSIFVSNTNAEQISAGDCLRDANKFLEEKMGYTDFYRDKVDGKDLNSNYAVSGGSAFSDRPIFVYGDQVAASADATTNGRVSDNVNGKIQYRAMGYAIDNSSFPNPDFPRDNQGYLATDKKWIKEPWDNKDAIKKLYGEDGKIYTRNVGSDIMDYIKKWVRTERFSPSEVEGMTGNRKFFIAKAVAVPDILKDNCEDFISIIQPPTEHSFGLGIAFYYWDGFNRLNYRTFLIKSFDLDINDIAAIFDPIPSSAVAGDDIMVGVNIKSTFVKELQDVPFKWEITKENGEPIAATYSGHASVESGNIDKIPAKGERVLYASFKMPDSHVKVKFEINKDGKNPQESYLKNNILDSGNAIKPVSFNPQTSGEVDLDYNVLTRKFAYSLGSTQAELILPQGTWNGNATGALNVENKAKDLLRDFTVENNPRVDEPSETIVRKPDVHTMVQRSDFGDDPQNGNWLNWKTPLEPKVRSGIVSYNGSVSRPYKYTYYCDEKDCPGHTGYGTATASFNPGSDKRTIKTYIYNGAPVIAPKVFENKINNNDTNSLRKDLFWTSELYKFDVIRWMFHMDEDGSRYGGTPVDGQYQRNFTQQCSATVNWANVNTMEHDYKRSRDAAKSRDYRNSEYDKAVFASDADFRNVPYPIKSGYYFNPTGTYTFTVQTVTYNNTPEDTKDHKDLVNAVTNSFHYESDLMYINNNKEAVNIKNEPLPGKGAGYERRSAALTAQNPNGVDGAVMLNVLDRNDDESRYSKEVEELPHYQDSDRADDNHEFFKEILEGYDESGTIGSKNNFKYREYIKDGQHMYKITEKTTVTVEINPQNRNVYTHAQMSDGEYTVKAWIGDIKLSDMDSAYARLGTLKGISVLDQIGVSVKGSMYEDTN